MRKVGLSIALMALATGASAQRPPTPGHMQIDHLVPEVREPPTDIRLVSRMEKDFPNDLRIIAISTFGPFPPFAVGLKARSDGYDLLGSEVVGASQWWWSKIDKLETYRCKANLARADGDAIVAAWDREVPKAYDDGGELPLIPDGDTTHYATRIGHRVMSGWSGANEGMPRQMLDIAFNLHKLCKSSSENANELASLRQAIRSFRPK